MVAENQGRALINRQTTSTVNCLKLNLYMGFCKASTRTDREPHTAGMHTRGHDVRL